MLACFIHKRRQRWCLCELQVVWMQKDLFMYLFDWINQSGAYCPLGLLSGPQYRRKMLSLVFMWTPRCNSLNAKRFIHVSVRLNKSVRGHMALWGYCLGPCTGESCCRWCYCVLQGVIVWMQKDSSMYLFGWINQLGGIWPLVLLSGPLNRRNCCHWCFCVLQHVIVLMQKDSSMYLFCWITPYRCGPLGLLSGLQYRRKLLSLVFMWTPRCNSLNAKDSFMYLFGWINQSGGIWPFGATVWAPVQEKVAVVGVFVYSRCNSLNAQRFIHVSLQLNKSVMGHMDLGGYCLGPSTGESCCSW